MVHVMYQQLANDMSSRDIAASFVDCMVYDNEAEQGVHVRDVDGSNVILLPVGSGRNGSSYAVHRDDFFSGRYDLFPPHEGMVYSEDRATCYFASRSPTRHWKKGLSARHYTLGMVGTLGISSNRALGSDYATLVKLFNPEYETLEEAFETITNANAMSLPVGQWWGVGFHSIADGLAIHYKTTPVAAMIDGNTVRKVNNNTAVLAMLKSQFPHLTWR